MLARLLPLQVAGAGAFTEKVEDRRQWQEDTMDYFDHINPGLKKFIKVVEAEKDVVDKSCAKESKNKYTTKVTADEMQVWRALQNLTSGEARKVITSVKAENVFRALQKLHMRPGPSSASKQGVVLMDFSGMAATPTKTREETRNLITDTERKTTMVEDVLEEERNENRAQSVFVRFWFDFFFCAFRYSGKSAKSFRV